MDPFGCLIKSAFSCLALNHLHQSRFTQAMLLHWIFLFWIGNQPIYKTNTKFRSINQTYLLYIRKDLLFANYKLWSKIYLRTFPTALAFLFWLQTLIIHIGGHIHECVECRCLQWCKSKHILNTENTFGLYFTYYCSQFRLIDLLWFVYSVQSIRSQNALDTISDPSINNTEKNGYLRITYLHGESLNLDISNEPKCMRFGNWSIQSASWKQHSQHWLSQQKKLLLWLSICRFGINGWL